LIGERGNTLRAGETLNELTDLISDGGLVYGHAAASPLELLESILLPSKNELLLVEGDWPDLFDGRARAPSS
jgi:hypothetical protein